MSSANVSSEQDLAQQLDKTLLKLKQDPSSITTEDARRLSENYDAHDERSARIISAVEAFAVANVEVHNQNPSLGQEIHTSLLTLVKDLHAAVTLNPGDVTDEVLKTAQSVVSKMQKAIGHTSAPNPEVEAELRQEITKIEHKIEQGTITKAEADHLHSLEARAHGHTEKGGITSIAQSVVAKRERQSSMGSGTTSDGGRARAESKSLPGLGQEKGVLGDRTNGSRRPSGGKELEGKIAELSLDSKGQDKSENIEKKADTCDCCPTGEVNNDDEYVPASEAKPHTREESQHVFGP
ncbi:hypothetical protein NX059_003928 [Plenodomus lindquistii]|nr:hypothetical protein NX059_003928 [Plenodomus lindquistii]